MTVEGLIAEFQKLSPGERERFYDLALAFQREPEEGIRDQWKAELRHRAQEFQEGTAEFSSWPEAEARLRAKHDAPL